MVRLKAVLLFISFALAVLALGCGGKKEVLADVGGDDDIQDFEQIEEVELLEEVELIEEVGEVEETEEVELLACEPQTASFCYEDHVYWYDSCGERGELKESCVRGCEVDGCIPEPETWELQWDFETELTAAVDPCAEPTRRIYQGRATMPTANTARFEFVRCDGAPFNATYAWVTAAGTDILEENDVGGYWPRVEHEIGSALAYLEDEGRRLVVEDVPIWPSELDLESAACDTFKAMALVTDQASNPRERYYYQHQSVTFWKRCP